MPKRRGTVSWNSFFVPTTSPWPRGGSQTYCSPCGTTVRVMVTRNAARHHVWSVQMGTLFRVNSGQQTRTPHHQLRRRKDRRRSTVQRSIDSSHTCVTASRTCEMPQTFRIPCPGKAVSASQKRELGKLGWHRQEGRGKEWRKGKKSSEDGSRFYKFGELKKWGLHCRLNFDPEPGTGE